VSASLVLIIVVATAYLATHLLYEWLAKRLLIVSGAEYLVLGILLGPQVTGVIPIEAAESFGPIIVLGTGWIGLTVGMQFYLPRLVRISGLTFRLAVVESLVTLAVVTGVLWWAFPTLGLTSEFWAIVPALMLGAIAVASTPAGLDIALRDRKRRGPVVNQLETSLGVNAFVAILTAGLVFAWVHRAPVNAPRPPTPTEWAVITVGVGVLGGTLFHLFLGEERKVDRLVVSMGGAVILAAGTAAYLNVSPVLATLVTGIVLVNTSRGRDELRTVLAGAERPFYYVLLLLAGVSWKPTTSATVIAVLLLYLTARTASKVYATRLSTRVNGATAQLGPDWGKALIGQGRLTVALALDYARRPELPIGDVVFTAALASVLLTEFAAARFVRAALLPIVEPLRDLAHRLPWLDDEPAAPVAAGPEPTAEGMASPALAARSSEGTGTGAPASSPEEPGALPAPALEGGTTLERLPHDRPRPTLLPSDEERR
jgi:Kef-type K+ transport system membrane component KefB